MGTFQSKYTGAQIEARLDAVTSKQDALVSGQNIKTVNNESLLGPGNITIQGGGGYILEGEYENEVFALTEGTFSDAYAQLEDGKSVYLRFTSDETGMSGLYLIAEAVYYNSTTIVFALDLTDANYIISINSNGLGSVTRDGLQPRLVSGTNIKTINNQPVLGSGNLNIEAGETDSSMSPTSENPVQNKVIYAQLQTKVGSETVDNIVELTKAQYDALDTKDPGTLYIITDAGEADGYVSITRFEQTQSSSVSGGSNVWTVYLSNGQSFSLTVKNGEQGNTGSSVAYPYELVNNLTTDDATKGLSAAQGKVIGDEVFGGTTEIIIDGTTLGTFVQGSIKANGDINSSAYNYRVLTLNNDGYTKVTGHGSSYSNLPILAFYNSDTPSSASLISTVIAATSYIDIDFDANVPEGTVTIVVCYTTNGTATPAEINLYKEVATPGLTQKVDDLESAADNFEGRVSNVEDELNGSSQFVNALAPTLTTIESTGIVASTGATATRTGWLASDYIPVAPNTAFVWRLVGASSYGVAFYSEQSVSGYISGIVNTGSEQSTVVPANARYFRCCNMTTGPTNYVKYYEPINGLVDNVSELDARVSKLEGNAACFDGKAIVKADEYILGLGASFMRGSASGGDTNNSWLYTMASKVGVHCYNDALGGTNICYHANRLYDGTILGTGSAPIENVAAVLIMHTHNKDVFTLPAPFASYTVAEYEANVLPFATTSGTSLADVEYAKAFDYCIKKIIALYKSKVSSLEYVSAVAAYMGTYIPKPCQIVLATHWHDARTIYNESVRKLAAKWGLPLIRFDDKIGFTKEHLNPSTGAQASIEFVGNIDGASPLETIDGVVYGWHPMCGSPDVYIQRKMAGIAKDSFELI